MEEICKKKTELFGNRSLKNDQDVFDHNAWDNVEWTSEQIKIAQEKIDLNSIEKMSDEKRELFSSKAYDYWDKFYSTHQDNFFKDKNWLFYEFPELLSNVPQNLKYLPLAKELSEKLNINFENDSKVEKLNKNEEMKDENLINETLANGKESSTGLNDKKFLDKELKIFELGCGVGNTVKPILLANDNPKTFVYCCDFSSNAIEIFKKHHSYDDKRCHAFVYDFTQTDKPLPIEINSIDIMIMIYALSAISPDKMQAAITNACKYLKPGGFFIFRDYGRYDMAQLRFKKGQCALDNFYVRGDGTQAYFFTEEDVNRIFTNAGLEKEWIFVDRRLQVNRSRQLKMFRVWIQAKFKKPFKNS